MQLASNAFNYIVNAASLSEDEAYTVQYPIGLRADNSPLYHPKEYTKETYIHAYQSLVNFSLPRNGILTLTPLMEDAFKDLVSIVLHELPDKIADKKNVRISMVLSCSTLEEVRSRTISWFINELSYESPKRYAEIVSNFFGFNLLDIPCFPQYRELKASRDVLVHNGGIANSLYQEKAGDLARANPGNPLIVDIPYFLASYENCLRLLDNMRANFHQKWPSQRFIDLGKK
ncbi:MAG: hypothetical protein QGG42_08775 [Phycisphaerae bacterium]|nr:hypothetical protein [Phycisphaerae bacterium]